MLHLTATVEAFKVHREKMNDRISNDHAHLGIKRFSNRDTKAYQDGALDKSTKELLGLVASMVLRCSDCIDYHLIEAVKCGVSDAELYDAMNIALVVGRSIVIPHLRHAIETLDILRGNEDTMDLA